MNNLISETNSRLLEIINNLTTIKEEYEAKLENNNKEIETQLDKVQKYKTEFFESKSKIEKMNSDIEGFESDYKKLVERFKDDELANILIAANKEISLKIDERKRKIVKDKSAMNELVDKAENVKQKLVKLTAEKKALELCLAKILDAFEFYSRSLNQIISYATDNKDNLCSCFHDGPSIINSEFRQLSSSLVSENNLHDDVEDDDNHSSDNGEKQVVQEKEDDMLDDVEDEELEDLEPVDLSDMVKVEENPEISDYDNENVIEGDEHKIVIESQEADLIVSNDNKDDDNDDQVEETKKKKSKKSEEEDMNINVDFDDSLEDDDSLYE